MSLSSFTSFDSLTSNSCVYTIIDYDRTSSSGPSSNDLTSNRSVDSGESTSSCPLEPASISSVDYDILGSYPRSGIGSDINSFKNIYTFQEHSLILKVRSLLDVIASGKGTLETLAAAVFGYKAHGKRIMSCQRGIELYSLVGIVFGLLSQGQFAYQRDIYYRNKRLFKSTENVRLLCCKLAFYLDTPPAQLNILPCPKGRMYGNLSLELTDGRTQDFSNPTANIIPHARFVNCIRYHCSIRQVLIVEKETAFFALIQCGFGRRFPWVVLVTGKGYPDVNTREVLGIFATDMPVSVLVDYDPDGAHIFRMYAEGGLKNTTPVLAHARWAGLHCSCGRIGNWGLDPESAIEFTAHDRRLSLHLVKEWEKSVGLRRRMAKMAYRGKKVELEAITQFRSMLLAYIDHILSDCD